MEAMTMKHAIMCQGMELYIKRFSMPSRTWNLNQGVYCESIKKKLKKNNKK
jgi:hypothetical protein